MTSWANTTISLSSPCYANVMSNAEMKQNPLPGITTSWKLFCRMSLLYLEEVTRPLGLDRNVFLIILSSSIAVLSSPFFLSCSRFSLCFSIIWRFIKLISEGSVPHSNGHGHKHWIGSFPSVNSTDCSFGELWNVSGVSKWRNSGSGLTWREILLLATSLLSRSIWGLRLVSPFFPPFTHLTPCTTESSISSLFLPFATTFLAGFFLLYRLKVLFSVFTSHFLTFFMRVRLVNCWFTMITIITI